MVDLGVCKCGHATSRVRIATPGDQINAELWGQRFEVLKVDEEA